MPPRELASIPFDWTGRTQRVGTWVGGRNCPPHVFSPILLVLTRLCTLTRAADPSQPATDVLSPARPGRAVVSRDGLRDIAVDEMREGVVVLTEEGTIADCNPAVARAIGIDPDDAVGTALSDAAPDIATVLEGDAASSGDASRDADATNATSGRVGELFVRSAADGDRRYQVTVSSFDDGNHSGRVVTLRDVTDHYRRRRRLSVLNRVLRHDLRNEMNVVLGYTEMLEGSLEGGGRSGPTGGSANEADAASAVGRIRDAATEMLDLSDQIRSVTATLDATDSTTTSLDAVGLLEALTDSLAREHPEARVSLDAPDSAWVTAIDIIDSAFDNLLENAIVHNHRSPPTVDVTVQKTDRRVTVTVADNGPGIAQEELATFQSAGETPLTHSSGFGLWLVVWLVEESGGGVSFDVGETGTEVTVRLPTASPPK